MDFSWDSGQRERYELVWNETRTWPDVKEGFFSREDWERCAGLGLTGLSVPAAHGGGGLGFLDTARTVEAFGRGCPDMGLVFATMAHLFACAMPVAEHGAPELRERTLPGLCSGELIGANAITEEDAGSDVTAITTRAVRDGGDYVITGAKSFVSNAPVADVFTVYASTDPAFGHLGLSAFAVRRDTPGLTVGEPFAKVGLDSCPAAMVWLDGCRVPAANRLGREGQGAAIFQSSMRWERTCLFAAYLGRTERLLERCVAHAAERRQFGRRIGGNQAVSHRIARLRLRLEAARLLLWQACWRLDRGEHAVLDIAMAKLAVSEGAVQAGLDAMQIFAGAGVRAGGGIERELRDALPATVFSGTSEIQLEQIAKELGL
ncbi:acyl-CoA dehydrogenase [Sphaerisporangium album]|uniref:Acyl-CoA dehydrogenase n=1 Tax=Sphaerisporangium album TaxID=509200 RepID=A0A367FSN6_9ACTN|nr:acyl-CoA dehydrogenase family protein [Sphaerisporangium album]RCG33321.1 acyl-CoA dehydrogenase [Sphaerisporangium album]